MQQNLGAFYGLLGQLQLAAFSQITKDTETFPELSDRIKFSQIAVQEFNDFQTIQERVTADGINLLEIMQPYRDWLDVVLETLKPSDWMEQSLIVYLGFGVANDFLYLIHRGLDERERDLVVDVLGDNGHGDELVALLAPIVAQNGRAADRLALWGRRLVGDVLHAIDTLVSRDDDLAEIAQRVLTANTEGSTGKLFSELTAAHSRRMQRLQLTP